MLRSYKWVRSRSASQRLLLACLQEQRYPGAPFRKPPRSRLPCRRPASLHAVVAGRNHLKRTPMYRATQVPPPRSPLSGSPIASASAGNPPTDTPRNKIRTSDNSGYQECAFRMASHHRLKKASKMGSCALERRRKATTVENHFAVFMPRFYSPISPTRQCREFAPFQKRVDSG